MRAFGIFSIAAAAALSFLPSVFATPVEANTGALVARDSGFDLGARSVVDLNARTGTDECTSILTELKVDLEVKIDALNCLTVETATKDEITVILTDVVSIIVDATVKVKALIGTGIVCDVVACASLLSEILIALCGALAFVLSIVADVSILLDVIVSVALGDCLCGLISALLAVVEGLLVALIPLVLSLAGVLVSLGLNVVGKLLTIC